MRGSLENQYAMSLTSTGLTRSSTIDEASPMILRHAGLAVLSDPDFTYT